MDKPEMIQYKPGLAMSDPIPVSLAAGDWLVFLHWALHSNTDGVNRTMAVIAAQITDAIYDQPSLKANEARAEENRPRSLLEIIQEQIAQGVNMGVVNLADVGHPREICDCTCPADMGPICNGECHE